MLLDYFLLSPTGNDTVLVQTPVPRQLHGAVAARLLETVGGEQVGFIEPATALDVAARLQMMGGEFCGNATMALAALLARWDGLPDGQRLDLNLEVSGCALPVHCSIRASGDCWTGTVTMPLPESTVDVMLETPEGPLKTPLVSLPGISHLILPASAGLQEEELRRYLPQWHQHLGGDALGALIWDAETSFLDPLVYVPSAGTLVRERGCGSGSAAVGSLIALQAGRAMSVPVRQPGGTITVQVEVEGGKVSALTITGQVSLLHEGQAEISL